MEKSILRTVSLETYKPMSTDQLADYLGVRKSERTLFEHAVDELHRSGRLLIGEDKTIHFPDREGKFIGTFRAHQRGFGFVIPSDPELVEDLFIPAEYTAGALTSDLVQANVSFRKVKGKNRLYGKIEKILARGKNKFVGTLFRSAKNWLAETDGKVLNKPIIIDDIAGRHVRAGDRVVIQLTEYPVGEKLPRGVLLNVLGPEGEPDVELQTVIEEFDLPQEFSTDVIADLDKVIVDFNQTIGEDLANNEFPSDRVDLRDKLIVTIDPIDARDFDDAISVDETGDGWELGVHIADVSAFVREDSPIDAEARKRANSVYLPRKVIPMIPEALSNGLCSLQESQDRLTKSAFIRYDKKGKVLGARFANSVIRSKKRLYYEQASAALEGKTDGLSSEVAALLKRMEKLAKAIYSRRESEGMIHLDLKEVELKYDEHGHLLDAEPADMSYSHTIIEMFMVEANESVARLLDSYKIPFLRRIHPDPAPEASNNLHDFIALLGQKIPKNSDRFDLQKLILSVANKPQSFAVSYAILRSLKPAEYSPKKVGHYALASDYYCHFTSPIRRYADLDVHRLLQLHLDKKLSHQATTLRQYESQTVSLGEHCSLTEKRAQDAERQLKETLILQLLSEQIGSKYEGVVTGISTLGPFIQIPKFLIEGLLPLDEMGHDVWQIEHDKGYIFGRRSGKRVKIGDPMRIVILSVDRGKRRLNFALDTESSEQGKKSHKPEKSKKGKTSSGRRRRRRR